MNRPEIIIIVAATRDLAIGGGRDLLYHISEDLKRFKKLTMGCPIIMGRKTFESFPNGALPGRRNIVVTRNSSYGAPGIEIAGSLEDALSMCADVEKCYIIGGGEIYSMALPLADHIEITLIDTVRPDATVRFPDLKLPIDIDFDHTDPSSGLKYTFLTL